jgi:hypothetical protein
VFLWLLPRRKNRLDKDKRECIVIGIRMINCSGLQDSLENCSCPKRHLDRYQCHPPFYGRLSERGSSLFAKQMVPKGMVGGIPAFRQKFYMKYNEKADEYLEKLYASVGAKTEKHKFRLLELKLGIAADSTNYSHPLTWKQKVGTLEYELLERSGLIEIISC